MLGKDGGGIIVMILLGIVSALVGGWIGSLTGLGTSGGLSIGSIITAVVGALLTLFIYRKIKKRWTCILKVSNRGESGD